METGDRRQEMGDGRQETGDGRQKTGDRRQETGDWRLKSEHRTVETGDGRGFSDVISEKLSAFLLVEIPANRESRKLVLIIVAIALLLDNMLLTTVGEQSYAKTTN